MASSSGARIVSVRCLTSSGTAPPSLFCWHAADAGGDSSDDEMPAQKPSLRTKPAPPKTPAKVARHVTQSKQDEQLGGFHAVCERG